MNAIYQIENIKTVFASMLVYNQFYEAIPFRKIKGWNIKCTATNKFWWTLAGYFTEPKIVVDVGHNEDGIVKIIEQLKLENMKNLHLFIVQ